MNLFCRSFSKTDDPPPKLSFIPNCYFGKQAAQAWGTRDYSSEETWSNISLKSYQNSLNFGEPDYYKYFQCKDFVSRPTSSGVCHTFNALDLDDILKKSNWLTSFKSSFKQAPKKEILKSEGIESENGFLFSLGKLLIKRSNHPTIIYLDTMQSYLQTYRARYDFQNDVDSFWVKVHQAGEIPWMGKNPSSWEKIEAHEEEMSTVFISIQGEKVSHMVCKSVVNLF